MSQARQAMTGLVKRPIKVKIKRGNEMLMDQIFQTTPIRIGRMLDNDLALPFDFISRYHCELRFDGEAWNAIDLGSKNGFLIESTQGAQVRLERINELKLEDGSNFFIQELNITLEYMEPVAFTESFQSSRSATDTLVEASAEIDAGISDHGHLPVVEVDLQTLMFVPHPFVGQARERALQMTTIWHDQILDTKEFSIGSSLIWDFNGRSQDLGTVGKEKSNVRVPKGCKPVDGAETNAKSPNKLIATLTTPTAFNVSDTIFVYFRYVPKSKELPKTVNWIDERMMDPLVFSSAVHGTAALTALVMSGKGHHPPAAPPEPERFATIIMPAPTPDPLPMPTATPEPPPQVAVQPTPEPTPEATPKPKKIAKAEPTPPPPKAEKIEKKVVKKVALKRKEEIPRPKEEPRRETKVAALPEMKEPPAPQPPAPPAPTPQPFAPKSVGALKAFALLAPGAPTANIANVEKIQVTRAPSSVAGPVMGATATQGTGEIITQLNQSAKGGGSGSGDGAGGVAVGGKSAGGAYTVGGMGGKAGNRKIKGSVLGGATYTELSKNDGLTREQVMKVVTKHQSEIQQCYEKALMSNPELSGSAEFEWEIAAGGSVNYAKVKSATLKNGEGLLDCVKGVFTKMKFPAAKNGENTNSTINLPFGRL